jgi:hypothetical protein
MEERRPIDRRKRHVQIRRRRIVALVVLGGFVAAVLLLAAGSGDESKTGARITTDYDEVPSTLEEPNPTESVTEAARSRLEQQWSAPKYRVENVDCRQASQHAFTCTYKAVDTTQLDGSGDVAAALCAEVDPATVTRYTLGACSGP